MCGICGLIGFNINQYDIELIKTMNDKQRHRGPDDEGIYFSDNIVLGHRRLSILDLSQAGHQPMTYMNKYVISYNGEVYNYLELRSELIKDGYIFKGNSDTEVILAAYDKWGVHCFNHFNGFWALAIYEIETKRTILSRDRFGIKPLHYVMVEDQILFASEIKALLCDRRINREANKNVILDYLVNGIVDFSDETFFEGIYKLPSGSYMVIDKSLNKEITKYYDIEFSMDIQGKIAKDQVNKFTELFNQSIKLRLRSDVPVGSCLSGGLDSSSIVCHVSKELAEKRISNMQETFSACYNGFKFDERKYINKVVEYSGAKPNYVFPSLDGFNEEFDQLVYIQEEPFGSTGIYASYCVMKEARKRNVPVLLDGQGADELLCGYRKSRIYYIKKLMRRRKYLRAGIEFLLSISQIKSSQSLKNEVSKIKLIIFKNEKLTGNKKFLSSNYKEFDLKYKYNNVNNFLYNDMTKISVPALLRYADRNSMAFAIEDRLPFLDYEFANYVAKLPLSTKLRNGYSKYIMRRALIMPKEIRKRKDKIGFATPESKWLVENSKQYFELFSNDNFRAKNFIDNKKIIESWDSIINGDENISLFRYICLEKWMHIFDVS